MSKKCIATIFEEANQIVDAQERISFLRKHDSVPLREILILAFHPKIKFLLPLGQHAPYVENNMPDSEGNLFNKMRLFNYFIEGHPQSNMSQLNREKVFIGLLESIDKRDAKLILYIKDKKFPYKLITHKFVNKCFPGLLPEEEIPLRKKKNLQVV